MARLLVGLGAALVPGLLWLLVGRFALLALPIPVAGIVVWAAARRPERVLPLSAIAYVAALSMALVPVDIWLLPTGRVDAGAGEVVWGTLNRPAVQDGHVRVLSGGCVVPRWNPTRYALWISF